jgi:hypothetical protein
MNRYEHLPFAPYHNEVQRRKPSGGGGPYQMPSGRQKSVYSQKINRKADQVVSSFKRLKNHYSGIIKPSLIFELEINQSVDVASIEKTLTSMGIHVLSSAENKKGFWIVFSDDEDLNRFKTKLSTYGSEDGAKYDFFNAFGELRDIPKEQKIGKSLRSTPLSDTPEFIDIELWKMTNAQNNTNFTEELKKAYPDRFKFHITDQLITKSFVLLRIKITSSVFEEIIELKEIARADRPFVPTFNAANLTNINLSEIQTASPDENAAGILIIDSGIVSNHPILEKCVGGEENFQSGEKAMQDTVGHGTAVAGCAAYGDIEKSITDKLFTPANWIFSAKVMYAEKNSITGEVIAVYDSEKLVENQFKEAVESFLSHSDYHIRVVNISLGNSQEIWHTTYTRQLPLAALIDELAYTFPNVVFVISTGNKHPLEVYESIDQIKEEYPKYLREKDAFKFVNPATSALALTVGSIAPSIRTQQGPYENENIKTAIAQENQPSPFTRTGPGINGMVKPELVEYGGNLILFNNYGRITEDIGGKLLILNNKTTDTILKFDYGTSFSAPKIAHLAGQIANKYPQRTANFIKNQLISSASHPFIPEDSFYGSSKGKALQDHLDVCGFGIPLLERAINSSDNRVVLFDEGILQLNKVRVYSLQLPEIFFDVKGKKRITVVLTFTPETRSTRGDSYLGNRMEFHLFHSVNPQELVSKYGNEDNMPPELKKFKIDLTPGVRTRNAGCHQKAWKEFTRKRPASPVSLVLINRNKWLLDENVQTNYCLSVTFEHEKEIDLYNQIRANIRVRARNR